MSTRDEIAQVIHSKVAVSTGFAHYVADAILALPLAYENRHLRADYDEQVTLNERKRAIITQQAAEIERLKDDYLRRHNDAVNFFEKLIAAEARAETAESKLADALKALDFVVLWAWRKDPPNTNRTLTDSERLSAIKWHPSIKARLSTPEESAS